MRFCWTVSTYPAIWRSIPQPLQIELPETKATIPGKPSQQSYETNESSRKRRVAGGRTRSQRDDVPTAAHEHPVEDCGHGNQCRNSTSLGPVDIVSVRRSALLCSCGETCHTSSIRFLPSALSMTCRTGCETSRTGKRCSAVRSERASEHSSDIAAPREHSSGRRLDWEVRRGTLDVHRWR